MRHFLFLSVFFSLTSIKSHAVLIDFSTVKSIKNISCEPDNIDFKKALWESDLAEKRAYSSFLTSENECLGESDQVYVEIYYQYKNEKIILNEITENKLKNLISENRVEEDLLNLISWLFDKIENFKKDEMLQAWNQSYGKNMSDIQKLMTPEFSNKEEIRSIYFQDNILVDDYKETISLFMFCRRNRNYHCLFLAKDKFGNPVKKEDGSLWWHPSLAISSRGLPSNIVNGQTPQGVHTVDSVMPEANRQIAFGKYRRLILNWVKGKFDDKPEMSFLPSESSESLWWRQASLSKRVGRKDLRIHGTGKINDDPTSTHFPFRKSAGCITQREGSYGELEFHDQRLLLDKLMAASDLEVNYENEERLKGVLYVIEINDKNEHVGLTEVEKLLYE